MDRSDENDTDQPDLAHLITRSALASTAGEMIKPICFAVLRLTTISNLVGCSTGRSAGLTLSEFYPRTWQRAEKRQDRR